MTTDTNVENMLSFPGTNVFPNDQGTHSVPLQSTVDTSPLFSESADIQMASDLSPMLNGPFSVSSSNSVGKETPTDASASGYSTTSASSSTFSSPCPEVVRAFQDFNWADTDHELVLQADVENDFCSNGYVANTIDWNKLSQEKPPDTFDGRLLFILSWLVFQAIFNSKTLAFPLIHPVQCGVENHPIDIVSNLLSTSLPRSATASPASYGDHVVQQHSKSMIDENFHFCPVSLNDRRLFNTSIESSRLQQQTFLDGSEGYSVSKKKDRCPEPRCRRVVKNLKAHLLTHQSERPEKCPIVTCVYHIKGFARKYDRDRHTWTHYKGTMTCGFCAQSWPPMKKSFNRVDVFKRHLTAVHGVEQKPPKSRNYRPTAFTANDTDYGRNTMGKCSTCSATFSNAPEFYEHLEGCVLRAVEQEQSSEDSNQKNREASKFTSCKASTSTSHSIIGNGNTFSKRSSTAIAGKNSKIRAFSTRRKGPKLWGCSNSRIKKNKERKKSKRVLYVLNGRHRLCGDEKMLKTGTQTILRLFDSTGSGSHRDAFVTVLNVEDIKDVLSSNEEHGPEVED
ncbi:hypothetical protein N7510_004173 [Penicillium lagena]|uniref:uncharacterized protein n=1 Tax=Penicillium lagena TaxID=94218 RepID=UPI002541A605|nr:uncharacterized protein N7510_004173 [Penicillium lagena]KAJ5620189.1 hypothetical protein N7510_004173 [Penicillium lagena]